MAKKPKKPMQPKGTPPVYDKQEMFDFFRASVARLRRDWDALAHLFMDGKRRAYLRATVPALADSISTSLTVSVYMGIAQLFDPLMTFNDHSKSNLVLRRVIEDLAPPLGTPVRVEIEADYSAMQPTVDLIRDWRNTIGAHRSLKTSLALVGYIRSGYKKPHPLPHIPLMKVHDVLERLVTTTDSLVAQLPGGFVPWYEPDVIGEAKKIFAAIGLN